MAQLHRLNNGAYEIYHYPSARYAGRVIRRGRRWLACDPDGKPAGDFPTRAAAIAALTA